MNRLLFSPVASSDQPTATTALAVVTTCSVDMEKQTRSDFRTFVVQALERALCCLISMSMVRTLTARPPPSLASTTVIIQKLRKQNRLLF